MSGPTRIALHEQPLLNPKVIRPSISSRLSRFVGRFATGFVSSLILGIEQVF